MNAEAHWEHVYGSRAFNQVSWFRPHLETSISLIKRATQERGSRIIDVGGGESTLIDDLLAHGYRNVSVLDISETAICFTQQRLGVASNQVEWLTGDVTKIDLPENIYDVWHDRAVFHFLTESGDRAAYVDRVSKSVRHGGHVVIGTFGPEGPSRCSGLDVQRYDAESLHGEFGKRFQLIDSLSELHQTPLGTTQQFLYCCLRLRLPSRYQLSCNFPNRLTSPHSSKPSLGTTLQE